jgi:5'-deoxynucleotidase YfbR-like HD superfamily hydrolase
MIKRKRNSSPRAWQRMLSGRRLDLLDPSPLDVEITDIALGLSRVTRWNGQTRGVQPYSVAEHSLLVERLFSETTPQKQIKWRLAALLHDAPEYVIGDMISPFKAMIGDEYRSVEQRLQAAIHLRFGLPPILPISVVKLIKKSDRLAAYIEATQLAGFSQAEARRFFGNFRKIPKIKIQPCTADNARRKFLDKFNNVFN